MQDIHSRQFNYMFDRIDKETQIKVNDYCRDKGLLKYRFLEKAINLEFKENNIPKYQSIKDLRIKMNKHCVKIGVFQHQFIKQLIEKALKNEGFSWLET